MTRQQGFTLTELLIALILLGVIAAFSIPKVLKATADQRAAALARETVATIEDAFYSRRMSPGISSTTVLNNLQTFIGGDLNTVTSSTGTPTPTDVGDAVGTGCLGAHTSASTGFLRFANGVVVTGMNGSTSNLTQNHVICIDTDGPGTGQVYVGNFAQPGTTASTQFTGKAFNWGPILVQVNSTAAITMPTNATAASQILGASSS